ncbi:MAG: PDZ domain-containing protein, partial [Calditrichaeota bacterium]
GEEVVSVSDLQTKIARHQPGDVVTLVIWRDRRKWEVDVQLAEAPLEGQPQAGTEEKKPEFKNLGITVRGIPEAELKNLKLDHGLLIEEVMPGSPAERAGVIPSTVLVSINSVPVGSVAQFERIIEEAKSGDILTLKILELSTEADRDGRIVFVEVP